MKWLSLVALPVVALALAPAAQAIPVTFTAHLTGPNENPVNNSPGIGDATAIFDTAAHTLFVSATFSGLTGTTMAAHIHCCIAPPGATGVATQTPTFSLFPLGVTSGSFSQTLDMTLLTSFNAPFVAANGGTAASAELALFNGAVNGMAYFNIHSTTFTGGEIRGFLVPVPEPATIGVFCLGLIGLGFVRRWTSVRRD
jgi:hypothetical protein